MFWPIPQWNLEEFNVHIIERGTKYVEKIAIDEKNDLEFFQVPAHNGLTEADYLYDFKSVSNSLPNNTVVVRKYSCVSEEVDKAFFSQALQDFCDQFPIFRLQEAALNMSGRTCFGKFRLDKKINQDEIKHQFLFLSIIFLAL
ncbi:hypothetical protein P5673_005822 [Acropora cervicornis]|uniref:Uncharacterized protein n=1 Tax=Acropora cervicornis TaxID=6130 RepID=A0AAD9QZI1_ACRCE|nr:hypothetical protein P5673_005822 [Acropora cervicornis]